MTAPVFLSRKQLGHPLGYRGKSVGREIVDELIAWRKEYKRYYALLDKLKKQGLVKIIENRTDGGKQWSITKLGKSFFSAKQQKVREHEALTISGGITIISYDIPERMRRERRSIREILKLIDFKPVHQSVWFGDRQITENFLKLLRERSILEYTHIFEVSKTGTLTDVCEQKQART